MILIDAIYINNSGGKVLLDYLVETFEKEKLDCFYLFDNRCENDYQFVSPIRKFFLKASLIKRHQFYSRNKLKFSKVLCFGNLPPSLKLDVPVFTYFHQPLFLEIPKSISILNKVKISLKMFVLNALKNNTNHWLVQSKLIKNMLASKYNLNLETIRVLPFYPTLKKKQSSGIRRKDGFVYISNGGIHKNHTYLIEAFCDFFDMKRRGILHLTIGDHFPDIKQFIENKKVLGYPIINYGFINREQLVEIYNTNEYLIFPSLAESFGLGIIEGIENGCKVIGADLPYTYAVCNPSIVFNPLDIKDIKRAFHDSQGDDINETEQLSFNQIDELMVVLKSN